MALNIFTILMHLILERCEITLIVTIWSDVGSISDLNRQIRPKAHWIILCISRWFSQIFYISFTYSNIKEKRGLFLSLWGYSTVSRSRKMCYGYYLNKLTKFKLISYISSIMHLLRLCMGIDFNATHYVYIMEPLQ